jgi:hypothetical protein
MQTELGSVEAEVSTIANESAGKLQSLQHWCSLQGKTQDVFGPQPLAKDVVAAALKEPRSGLAHVAGAPSLDLVDAVKEASLASLRGEEERQFAAALAASSAAGAEFDLALALAASQAGTCRDQAQFLDSSYSELARALAASRCQQVDNSDNELARVLDASRCHGALTGDCDLARALAASRSAQGEDDAALQAALRLSSAPSAIAPRGVGFGGGMPSGTEAATTIDESDSDLEMCVVNATPLAKITTPVETPEPKRSKLQGQTYYPRCSA